MELIKLAEKFNTQGKCIAYLEKQRWSGVPVCPYCGSAKSSRKTREFRHTCTNCGRSYSVLVGTILEATKLPITKWFAAIRLILNAKKGISSLQLARDLNVNKNTAWYLQKRIRMAMQDNNFILKGIVEIKETYVGGSLSGKGFLTKLESGKNHKAGTGHQVPVLGMISRSGRIVLKVIEKSSGDEIKPFIRSKVAPESTIITEGSGIFSGLTEHFERHVIRGQSHDKRRISRYNTCTLEGFWMLVKRSLIGQYHKISKEHLQEYLNELAFKQNYRKTNMYNLLLNNLLQPNIAYS